MSFAFFASLFSLLLLKPGNLPKEATGTYCLLEGLLLNLRRLGRGKLSNRVDFSHVGLGEKGTF